MYVWAGGYDSSSADRAPKILLPSLHLVRKCTQLCSRGKKMQAQFPPVLNVPPKKTFAVLFSRDKTSFQIGVLLFPANESWNSIGMITKLLQGNGTQWLGSVKLHRNRELLEKLR